MEKIKDLSLKAAIIIYMAAALAISTVLSFSLTHYAENVQEDIWFKYVDKEEYMESIAHESGNNYLTIIPRIPAKYMSGQDVFIVEACDVMETWGGLILSFMSCTIAVFLFYRKKLRTPLRVLSRASNRISENDLAFEVTYESKDEMGRLCKEFEKMRRELANNKKKVWRLVEDERTLRSAIAHDIRTPVALVKGNLEIIDEFFPLHKLSEEKVAEIVTKTIQHVEHLEHFVDIMKYLNSIVDLEPEYKETSYKKLAEKVYEIQKELCEKSKKDFAFEHHDLDCVMQVDPVFVIEVEENLLTNALRYARNKVTVSLGLAGDELELVVEDDGPGFQESPKKLLQAYGKRKEEKGDVHYGLGLYISKSLCSAHRGELCLENMKHGGARAVARFEVNSENPGI